MRWRRMKFLAQVKEVKRLATASNDTEFKVVFLTSAPLTELFEVRADELVEVDVKKAK